MIFLDSCTGSRCPPPHPAEVDRLGAAIPSSESVHFGEGAAIGRGGAGAAGRRRRVRVVACDGPYPAHGLHECARAEVAGVVVGESQHVEPGEPESLPH